jgi:spore germination cell wall hydrolase CwlJ-like protein
MDILGITLWREARGEGLPGLKAVYHVINNRALDPRTIWPDNRERVCMQAYQFSCWNTSDPQRNKYPPFGDDAYAKVTAVVLQPGDDPTGGATAYYDISIPPPSWATDANFTCQIGKLRFHKV